MEKNVRRVAASAVLSSLLRGGIVAVVSIFLAGFSLGDASLHAQVAPAPAIIDNGVDGTVQMGINPEGHLIVPGGTLSRPDYPRVPPPEVDPRTTDVGLRYMPTNGEAVAPGCPCEGWGIAGITGVESSFVGYANRSEATPEVPTGVFGLNLVSGTVAGSGSKPESSGNAYTSIVTAGAGRVQVTHKYAPSASPNLYRVDVTIQNLTESLISNLQYRRVMDWDVPRTTFYEWVEIHVGNATNVIRATTDGFRSANPGSTPGPFAGSPPTTLVPGPESSDYFGGPSDQGALFDFGFGTLEGGASKTFQIYYGAAANRDQARAALAVVGAEVYSFGMPSTSFAANAPADTTDNVFIFAFGGVGGTPVPFVPVTVTKHFGTGPQSQTYPTPYDRPDHKDALTLSFPNVLVPFDLPVTFRTVACAGETAGLQRNFPGAFAYGHAAAGGNCVRDEIGHAFVNGVDTGAPPQPGIHFAGNWSGRRAFHAAFTSPTNLTNPTPRPAWFQDQHPPDGFYDANIMTSFARNECDCIVDGGGRTFSNLLVGDLGNVRTDLVFKWFWPLVPPPPIFRADFPRTAEGWPILPLGWPVLPVAFDLTDTLRRVVGDRQVALTVATGPAHDKTLMTVTTVFNFNTGNRFRFIPRIFLDDGTLMINKYLYLLNTRAYPAGTYLVVVNDVGAGPGMAQQFTRFVIR